MVKGGARIPSAKKAMAKGMGIPVFFNVLEEINRLKDWVSVDVVMKTLHFGGDRNETCRSYFKELWRYGLIERKEGAKIIECTPENWRKGGRPLYKISNKGREILKIPDQHRVFALAWLVVKADNENDFEQLHKALNVFRRRNVSLSMFKACEITGVVRDSIKALMYGWLEPLGFLDRTDGYFKLNKEYYDYVASFKFVWEAMPENLSNQVSHNGFKITMVKELAPIAPMLSQDVRIPLDLEYGGSDKIQLNLICEVYPLFKNRLETPQRTYNLELRPNEKIKFVALLKLRKKNISESCKRTELGVFKIKLGDKEIKGALPTIFLTTKAHLHEMNLAKLLEEIGYPPITFTKSDRPDMILFPERKERDLEKFLHNDELKILVETTSVDTLTLNKLRDDLKNFKEHTTKVLKINAKRTLAVGISLAPSIEKNTGVLLKKYHPFTVVSLDNLNYLKKITKIKKDNSWSTVGKILTYNGVVEKKLIDKVFSNRN